MALHNIDQGYYQSQEQAEMSASRVLLSQGEMKPLVSGNRQQNHLQNGSGQLLEYVPEQSPSHESYNGI